MNDDDTIDITGLDEAEVIAALHNGTRPLGMGFLHARPDMTADDVRKEIADIPRRDGVLRFDYYHGRPVKVSVGKGRVGPAWLYDRDAGPGACAAAIDSVRVKAAAK